MEEQPDSKVLQSANLVTSLFEVELTRSRTLILMYLVY